MKALAGRLVGYGALIVALSGGVAWVLHTHDARVRAEQQLATDRVMAAEVERQHAATVAALEQAADEAQARAATIEQIRTAIDVQPVTTSCAGSPAVRAAVDGLRRTAGGRPGTASANPGKSAKLPR